MKRKVIVNDKMQKGYYYYLTEPIGKQFNNDFKPQLTPKQMLMLGVFGGKYMTDCIKEFDSSWFKKAKLSPTKKDMSLNYYGVHASLSLHEWQKKGLDTPR